MSAPEPRNRELIRREVIAAYRARAARKARAEGRAKLACWIGVPLFLAFLFIIGSNQ